MSRDRSGKREGKESRGGDQGNKMEKVLLEIEEDGKVGAFGEGKDKLVRSRVGMAGGKRLVCI